MSTSLVILEQGLYQFLLQQPDLVSLITPKGLFLGAVPEKAPDNAVCFQKISSQPDTTMDGPSGYCVRRYQFSFYSKDYPNVMRMQEATRRAIDGFSGLLPTGQRVFNIIRDNELDGFDDNTGEFRSITDYFIHFLE